MTTQYALRFVFVLLCRLTFEPRLQTSLPCFDWRSFFAAFALAFGIQEASTLSGAMSQVGVVQ
jgi:predicted component of type VI protein secretion system